MLCRDDTIRVWDVYVCAGEMCARIWAEIDSSQVYLQENKKKAEAKGKKCHAKTMWSLEKPI
jgi:hypothetical protein